MKDKQANKQVSSDDEKSDERKALTVNSSYDDTASTVTLKSDNITKTEAPSLDAVKAHILETFPNFDV